MASETVTVSKAFYPRLSLGKDAFIKWPGHKILGTPFIFHILLEIKDMSL